MKNKIRVLPQFLANQIAAGEVIARPASALKELLENSLDAGASLVEVVIRSGGKTFLEVKDNGIGMSKDDLSICLIQHSTSKLSENNLENINTLGFRGEALASIASISNITIKSKTQDQEHGYEINNSNNIVSPSAIKVGTEITIKELFFKTPARLKFLKSDNSETASCYKVFKSIAIANPHVHFRLFSNGKLVFDYQPSTEGNLFEDPYLNSIFKRSQNILGKDFMANSIGVRASKHGYNIYGFISAPTYDKGNTDNQYVVINGRVIKSKNLSSVIKVAYNETMSASRLPSYIIFIEIPFNQIDVNVSPTKNEVRLRDESLIKGFIISSLKNAIAEANRPSNINNTESTAPENYDTSEYIFQDSYNYKNNSDSFSLNENRFSENHFKKPNDYNNHITQNNLLESHFPLGIAKAQFHKNWIISEHKGSIIIIDQHAAHERIRHESLLEQYNNSNIISQTLLVPVVVKTTEENVRLSEDYKEEIIKLGFNFEVFGHDILNINEIPTLLRGSNIEKLFIDLLNDLRLLASPKSLHTKIHEVISRLACHSSIKSGNELNKEDMNKLLRQMEQTNNYGQCSHGRPTFIKIELEQLEKMFDRT